MLETAGTTGATPHHAASHQVAGARTWLLALIGGAEALLATLLGYPAAAQGILAGMPVGIVNHWLTQVAVRRWQGAAGGAGWVLGSSMLRLALAAALLWWASTRGLAFLLGTLAGLLVEVAGYLVTAPRCIRQRKAGRR